LLSQCPKLTYIGYIQLYSYARTCDEVTRLAILLQLVADLIHITEELIKHMKRGKAAGLDGLITEHLQHCQASLPTCLAKLFNLIMETGIVPDKFELSYSLIEG